MPIICKHYLHIYMPTYPGHSDRSPLYFQSVIKIALRKVRQMYVNLVGNLNDWLPDLTSTSTSPAA